MKTILLIDDDIRMHSMVGDYLRAHQFDVIEALNGASVLEKIKNVSVDLVLLDVMMPEKDGWDTCYEIRQLTDVPILFLTALSSEEDEVYGYDLGADDYITKPFRLKVLLRKIKSMLRRSSPMEETVLSCNGIEINLQARSVKAGGVPVKLRPREFALLVYLIENKGVLLTREQIINRVWGLEYEGEYRTVDTHVKRIREKIGEHSQCIHTIWGEGYKIEDI